VSGGHRHPAPALVPALALLLALAAGCQCGAFHALDDYACDPAAPSSCPNGRVCTQVASGDFFCVVPAGATDSGPLGLDASGACDCSPVPPLCSMPGTCPAGSSTCAYPPDDGAPCNDGSDCTTTDTCAGGACAGTLAADADGDGFRAIACGGASADCNDSLAIVSPALTENGASVSSCVDGLDNDCDALPDLADPDCLPTCATACGDEDCTLFCGGCICALGCLYGICASPTCWGPGTECALDCTVPGATCVNVTCSSGAYCRLYCGANPCLPGYCGDGDGAWDSCGGGVWVCNVTCY
jgi:hypothetical protein